MASACLGSLGCVCKMQLTCNRTPNLSPPLPPPCRVVGVHKLLLLNLYPFLQKYIAPHQRDVTVVLAALVQGVHELVPPDSLAPVLRQLVDQFVHDRYILATCTFSKL